MKKLVVFILFSFSSEFLLASQEAENLVQKAHVAQKMNHNIQLQIVNLQREQKKIKEELEIDVAFIVKLLESSGTIGDCKIEVESSPEIVKIAITKNATTYKRTLLVPSSDSSMVKKAYVGLSGPIDGSTGLIEKGYVFVNASEISNEYAEFRFNIENSGVLNRMTIRTDEGESLYCGN